MYHISISLLVDSSVRLGWDTFRVEIGHVLIIELKPILFLASLGYEAVIMPVLALSVMDHNSFQFVFVVIIRVAFLKHAQMVFCQLSAFRFLLGNS